MKIVATMSFPAIYRPNAATRTLHARVKNMNTAVCSASLELSVNFKTNSMTDTDISQVTVLRQKLDFSQSQY